MLNPPWRINLSMSKTFSGGTPKPACCRRLHSERPRMSTLTRPSSITQCRRPQSHSLLGKTSKIYGAPPSRSGSAYHALLTTSAERKFSTLACLGDRSSSPTWMCLLPQQPKINSPAALHQSGLPPTIRHLCPCSRPKTPLFSWKAQYSWTPPCLEYAFPDPITLEIPTSSPVCYILNKRLHVRISVKEPAWVKDTDTVERCLSRTRLLCRYVMTSCTSTLHSSLLYT